MHWLRRYICLTSTSSFSVRHRQFFTSICHIFQLYLLILAFAFAAQPASAISVKLCRNLVDESSSQIHFSLYLYQFVTVFLAYGVVNLLASHLRPPVQMMWVFLRGQNKPYFKSVDNYKISSHLEVLNISPPPCPLHQEQCSVGYISETPQLTATFFCWHGMIFLWNCFILILIHCVQCSTAVEVQDEAQESNCDIIHGLSGMYSFIENCSPVPWYLQTPRFVVFEGWRGSTGTHETDIKDRASLTNDFGV